MKVCKKDIDRLTHRLFVCSGQNIWYLSIFNGQKTWIYYFEYNILQSLSMAK